MFHWPHFGAPHALPAGYCQPSLPCPPTRTFAPSQTRCTLLSLLVNIDLHIRLNIDVGARSPFPTRASNPQQLPRAPLGLCPWEAEEETARRLALASQKGSSGKHGQLELCQSFQQPHGAGIIISCLREAT